MYGCWIFFLLYIPFNASKYTLLRNIAYLMAFFNDLTIGVDIWVILKPRVSCPNPVKKRKFYYLMWMPGGDLYTE